ncbi:MAG: MBG domain-containing protein, partial [Gallionella sp.]|nr:MBG domain-containing protein [Gallionella sp.]
VLAGVTATGATGTNAGSYTSTASGTDGNYNLTFANGTLTISKANATVTANSGSGTYSGVAQSVNGFSASGLVNGETAGVLTGVTAGGSGTNAGSYATIASGTDGNYNLSFVNGTLTINNANTALPVDNLPPALSAAVTALPGGTSLLPAFRGAVTNATTPVVVAMNMPTTLTLVATPTTEPSGNTDADTQESTPNQNRLAGTRVSVDGVRVAPGSAVSIVKDGIRLPNEMRRSARNKQNGRGE